MIRPTCSTCAFHDPGHRIGGAEPAGLCRFDPPSHRNDPPNFLQWPVVLSLKDRCGKHEPVGAIDDYKYRVDLRAALAPFLRVAEACRSLAQQEGEDLAETVFLLDVADDDGNGLSLSHDQFIALADAVPEV